DDAGDAHPRVLLTREDFPAVRDKVANVPALQKTWQETRQWRPADRYIMEGETSGLEAVETITHARALVEEILERGYIGPTYAIGLARPLRRYVLSCDVLWDCFSEDEKREARRVCA